MLSPFLLNPASVKVGECYRPSRLIGNPKMILIVTDLSINMQYNVLFIVQLKPHENHNLFKTPQNEFGSLNTPF